MLFSHTISSLNFSYWLFKEKENSILLKLALIILVISFTYLKIVYPYPNFMPPDSDSYIEAAHNNDFINIWAIGYSKFLRLINCFTSSSFIVVLLQFILLQISILYFLFSIRYLLSPGKILFRAIFLIAIANPVLINISNFISSDSLFFSLSLIWFTQLIWIIHKPNFRIIISHSIILLIAFSIRHNALYYPIISGSLLLTLNCSIRIKLIGLLSTSILLSLFIIETKIEYYSKTKTKQYSAFGGWQLAANALYGYYHSIPIEITMIPNKFKELHSIVNQQMDSIRRLNDNLIMDIGTYYLWDFNSPLRLYMDKKCAKDTNSSFFSKWASMAPLYSEYGLFLIRNQPENYFRFFVLPNLKRYYAPPSLFMGFYNLGNKTVSTDVAKWFEWRSKALPTRNTNRKIYISDLCSTIISILNPLYILSNVFFIILCCYKKCNKISKLTLLWMFAIWLSNLLFSITTAPIELRYQLFPMTLTFVFTSLIISFLIKEAMSNNLNDFEYSKRKHPYLNQALK